MLSEKRNCFSYDNRNKPIFGIKNKYGDLRIRKRYKYTAINIIPTTMITAFLSRNICRLLRKYTMGITGMSRNING